MFLLLSLSLLIMSQHSNEIVHLSIASASMCDISVMPGISLMLAIYAMSTMFAMSLDCQVCHICYVFLNLVYISHLEVSEVIVIFVSQDLFSQTLVLTNLCHRFLPGHRFMRPSGIFVL